MATPPDPLLPVEVRFEDWGGPKGDPGPRGPAGEHGADIASVALRALSSGRAVRSAPGGVTYASSTPAAIGADVAAADVVGVTVGAAEFGADVTIRTGGVLVEPSWSWTPGPVYLGALGALTQVAPGEGALAVVGLAIAPTAIVVGPQPSILL